MLISLEVNDNKAKLFVDFLKDRDYVKINRSELDEGETIHLLNDRLAEYEKDPSATVNAGEALKKLKVKYGL